MDNETKRKYAYYFLAFFVFTVIVFAMGYWRGGREVNNGANGASTTKLLDAVASGQQKAADDIHETQRAVNSAGAAIDSAIVAGNAIRESVETGQRGNTESSALIREGLEITGRDEQVFGSVERLNKAGTAGGQEAKDADRILVGPGRSGPGNNTKK